MPDQGNHLSYDRRYIGGFIRFELKHTHLIAEVCMSLK